MKPAKIKFEKKRSRTSERLSEVNTMERLRPSRKITTDSLGDRRVIWAEHIAHIQIMDENHSERASSTGSRSATGLTPGRSILKGGKNYTPKGSVELNTIDVPQLEESGRKTKSKFFSNKRERSTRPKLGKLSEKRKDLLNKMSDG